MLYDKEINIYPAYISEFNLNDQKQIIHGGQNRPHFFSKIRAEKNGLCNTDSPRLLIDY